MHKELMKISSIKFGMGGYQDAQFGVWINFSSKASGVGTGYGFWSTPADKNCKWTEEERIKFFGELTLKIIKWIEEAKVSSIDELKGIPVEVTFEHEHGRLTDWRILTEVI